MSTARDTVICTLELLELLLTHLPMRDLLVVAPLVSKTWQAITLTPALQRALFFEPDPSSEPSQNPLLVELFPPFFASPAPNSLRWPGTAASIMAMPWSKAPEAFQRADASWRRMLVTQPPTQTMTIKETCDEEGVESAHCAMLKDLSLRMGVLYDLTVPFVDRVASSFCMHWHNYDRDIIGLQADLTLAVQYTQQCSIIRRRKVDKRFYSEGWKKVDIDFGKWESDSD